MDILAQGARSTEIVGMYCSSEQGLQVGRRSSPRRRLGASQRRPGSEMCAVPSHHELPPELNAQIVDPERASASSVSLHL